MKKIIFVLSLLVATNCFGQFTYQQGCFVEYSNPGVCVPAGGVFDCGSSHVINVDNYGSAVGGMCTVQVALATGLGVCDAALASANNRLNNCDTAYNALDSSYNSCVNQYNSLVDIANQQVTIIQKQKRKIRSLKAQLNALQ